MADRAVGHVYLVGQSLGHYRVLEKIGEGGMGQVYRGRDEHLARDVAIKVFPPGTLVDENERKRFRKEAQTLSQLNHPNIATIYDFDTFQGIDFLAMEYIAGETLSDKIAAGPLSEKDISRLGTQLAEGLVAAHAAGVIHCDIKPGNLRVTQDGRLKIFDFGLAKIIRTAKMDVTTVSLNDSPSVAGTLPYMAPEQIRGQSLDARTDIYGAGAALYEMATGKRPFHGVARLEVISAVMHELPVPPSTVNPQVSPQLEMMILKCLEKDSDDRYATAADLLVDLRVLQRPKTESSRFRAPVRRSRLKGRLIAAATAIVLALLLAAVPAVRQRFKGWMGIDSIPAERRVAVLPFSVLGEDQQATPFSDGLTETLTAKLTQLTIDPTFQVISAPEIRANRMTALEEARNQFGVTIVLDGNLRRSGDNLRINIALVDTRTRRQLRAASLTVPASDPFAVQDQVVQAVVGMLDLDVPPDEFQKLETHGTQVASAYDLYLQGRGYLQNYDKPENIDNAIRVFSSALEIDPKYALAYAGRGDAYWQKYDDQHETRWMEASQQDCQRAVSLSNGQPAARVCLGRVYRGTGRYREAAAEFEQAIEQEPTNDRAYVELATAYSRLGNPAQAEATYRRAIKLRPRYWAGYNWLGVFYYQRAQYRQAAEMFEQVVALAPDNARGLFNLAAAYTSEGRYNDAITVLQHSIAVRPEATAFTDLGNAYFYLHRFEEAGAAYEQAVKLDPEDMLLWWNLGDGYYWTPGKRAQSANAYQHAITLGESSLKVNPKDAYTLGILAICHAMRDEKKAALESLQGALRLTPDDPETRFKAALIYNHFGDVPETLSWLEKATAVGFSRTMIRDTPDFDGLRNNDRFQKLLGAK
jgi:tetratricopeptide (TPR) repeat protein/predicted Ser/Thr protein kinase